MIISKTNWAEVEQKAINVLSVYRHGVLMYKQYRMPDKTVLWRFV